MRDITLYSYEGAYGLTVRIYAEETESLLHLREEISRLILGEKSELDFASLDGVKIYGVETLILFRTDKPYTYCIDVKYARNKMISIFWYQDIEQLITIVALIDGLIKPGHQYLTETGEDVVIILSYKEKRI